MIDLAEIVCDAIKQSTVTADEVSVDRPQTTEFFDQTTIVVTEKESVLNDEHADDEDGEPAGTLYTTTLQVIVMAKDRETAKRVCWEAVNVALEALRKKRNRDYGPILAVWRGSKFCGPASFGGVFLECSSASREIIVCNTIEP